MKVLIDEANRMLQSLQQSDPKEKTIAPKLQDDKMAQLQRQLDELKKASLRPFRLSRMACTKATGLLDSGATHPRRARRKGERVGHLPKVQVTLAGDQQVTMHLSPTGVINGEESADPIVPMGILAGSLKCSINWCGDQLTVIHPKLGPLDVKIQDGCPMVTHDLALKLIEEIETKASFALRAFDVNAHTELQWIQRIVNEHPVFANLPNDLKQSLVEIPATDLKSLANRRIRKFWKREGVLVHAFSGEDSGYTLRRAFHEVGGDKRAMLELDVLHGGPQKDLSPEGQAYPALLRLAMDGTCKGWIGGPPCRTRSMLRHLPVQGLQMPRPLRAWEGGEHGLQDLSQAERDQVFLDDVLMFRFLLLYVISEEVRQANKLEEPVSLLLEQPADLAHMPEVVTIWRTPAWKELVRIYGLHMQTFNQSEFAAVATKPTTIGGNLRLQVPMPGRRGAPRDVEGKSKGQICEEARLLSRWPPLMMRAIATSLQLCPMKGSIKFRALSWKEHVATGHTPFRKDCLVCQESSTKDCHHRRSREPPRAGVLSIDMPGPFNLGTDLHGRKGKYLLVGAFTWLAPGQTPDDFVEEDPPEVPEGAPELKDHESEEKEIEDADDVWGEIQNERNQRAAEREERRRKADKEKKESSDSKYPQGSEDVEEERKDEKKDEEEEKKVPEVTVTRLCTPLPSKNRYDVLKAIIDMYLRLRSDGFVVTQIHSDHGGEFSSEILEKWCASRSILHTYTAGDQPQSNGRVEASVQWIKAEMRRILHAAGAPFNLWPLAARNINERLRLKQIGKNPALPNFMAEVLVRKRFWRARELLPTQERALYIGPSWVHHGHWIQREDGTYALTRMVMHQLKDPPKDDDWIGLEDELAPTEVRRRIRGKVALNHLSFGEAFHGEAEEVTIEEQKEEEEKEESILRTRKVIEEEMKFAMEDDSEGSYFTVDAIANLKQLTASTAPEEVLQTRIVGQQEVRKHLQDWIDPIKAELKALFETKKALQPIDSHQVQQLVAEGKAEILPSKMVWTVKPSPTDKLGRRKARLVACGNFQSQDPDQAESLFAGGATGVALRASLSIAPQKNWQGYVADIKTAFLNAPMKLGGSGSSHQDDAPLPKRAIIKPPPILVMAGLARPDEHWEAVMALYGYKESPKLWSDFRDDQLANLKIPAENNSWLVLDQMITEPNMWRILKFEPGPLQGTQAEQLVGILLVYVDDLLLLGDEPTIQATIQAIQAKWETSIPEKIDKFSGVRFLGAELYNDGPKWWMTQRNYIQDLLARNLGGDRESWPTRKIPMLAEPDTREDPPGKDAINVKEAQRIIGELVWISTRTRPDLSFAINRLASLITKDPQLVIELSKNIWYYLAATIDHGLQFENQEDEKIMNIYTDAPFNDVSTGCHLVMWGSSLLLWKSGKQSVLTASTAEAELVEILEGALSGDAVRVVLEEALDLRARAVSHTDNTASISIVTGDSGSWRTRHLKKRAHILKTKVIQGDWLLRHLAGADLPAGLGTKVLSSEKFAKHKRLMGMYLGDDVKKDQEGQNRKPEGESDVEKREDGFVMNAGRTKQALKAIILFARLAKQKEPRVIKSKSGSHVFPIPVFSDSSSGPPFFIILTMVFSFGLLIGAVVMWFAVYPYFQRVALVTERSNVVPRPTFLFHHLPEGRASQPRREDGPTKAAGASTLAADAPSSAADGRAAGARSSAAGASSTAAGARASTAAAGASSSAADASSSAAGASSAASVLPAADAGASEGANLGTGVRRRQRGARSRVPILYVTQMGQRYHSDFECHGLRNARSIHEAPRCSTCGPAQSYPTVPLYGVASGGSLHESLQHVQNLALNSEVKRYEPCAICMFGG